MLPPFRTLRPEFRPMLRLATPVVLAELGWMTMGLVDTVMVGALGPEAIGATGIGSSLFMGVVIFAMGLMLGLDSLVSRAFGAGDLEACHRWLVHGVTLALVISLPFTIGLFRIGDSLDGWGLTPEVLALTRPYLEMVTWSVAPLLLYSAFRRYLQGMGVVTPIMFALVTANIVNVVFNWILIYGHLGAPAMGVRGSALATVLARVMMAALLLGVILVRERGRRPGLFETSLRIEAPLMWRLIALGLPAALQITLEVGVFASATALAGRLPAAALAAHQIAVNIAAFTFMVPLGVSSAAAVRVGHAIGRRDVEAASRSGWTALVVGAAFMFCSAAAFVAAPAPMIAAFTTDRQVLAIGIHLLTIGAVFQLFDGVQAVATGALRGLGDTRTAMIWNLAGHWFVGLPLGYVLCFWWGLGVIGLWWGLTSGLVICGIGLLGAWSRRIAAAPGLLSETGRRTARMADQNRRSTESSAQPLEENAGQRQSDATPDAIAAREISPIESSDGDMRRGSDANGTPAFDETEGEERRKLYEKGATLVSKID